MRQAKPTRPNRKGGFTTACIGAALVTTATMADIQPLFAAQTPPVQEDPTHVAADFTIYVGGFLFVEGKFNARLEHNDYQLATQMNTVGVAASFYPADYKLASEGALKAEHVEPRRFFSDTKAKKDARVLTLTYDKSRMPRLSATPPYSASDLKDVKPALQLNTQDPVSAFMLPVAGGANPCARTIAVFDGRRRFNLTFNYIGEKKMTTPNTAYPDQPATPITAIVCTIRYEAIAPPEKKRKFTTMLRRNDDMKIWLAPFDGGRVYMPVRFELRTPIGGAVMELQNLTEHQVADPVRKRQITAEN
jgi:hypothetical protein